MRYNLKSLLNKNNQKILKKVATALFVLILVLIIYNYFNKNQEPFEQNSSWTTKTKNSKGSCKDLCEKKGSPGDCWCDPSCEILGDCCNDKLDNCGSDYINSKHSHSQRSVSVKDFKAKGDGEADDTQAFADAISAISADNAEIRTLFIPEGTYITKTIQLLDTENITIFGQNRNTTILKLDTIHSNDAATVINLNNVENITIKGLTIDGSKDLIQDQIEKGERKLIKNPDGTTRPMGGGHGIRTGGSFHTGLIIEDITIQNCHSYGLGFQKGDNSNFYLNNFIVQNTGADGIDFKNKASENGNINITNGFVKNFGTLQPGKGKAGIDVRGNMNISNINIELNERSNKGLRIRKGGVDHGLGGEGVINNLNILGAELPVKNYVGISIEQDTPKNYTFNNIYVKDANLAQILGTGGVFNNMVSENAPGDALNIGWDCTDRKPEVINCNAGRNIIISNLQIKNPKERAIRIRNTAKNVIINGFNLSNIGHAQAIEIHQSSENVVLTNGFIETGKTIAGNTSSKITKTNIFHMDGNSIS